MSTGIQPESIVTTDATLYTRPDIVEASGQVLQPVMNRLATCLFAFPNYHAGTWEPRESDEMLARNGHVWRVP